TGGTLSYIDMMGSARFVAMCEKLAARHGARFAPSKLLLDMASKNETFYGRFAPRTREKAAGSLQSQRVYERQHHDAARYLGIASRCGLVGCLGPKRGAPQAPRRLQNPTQCATALPPRQDRLGRYEVAQAPFARRPS